MKTVRSFANEEEEAEVYARKLQQVYKLNRKEAAAYMYYVWGSGVRVPSPGQVRPWGARDTKNGGPCVWASGWLHLTVLTLSWLSARPRRSLLVNVLRGTPSFPGVSSG